MVNKYGPLLIEFVTEICKECIFASNICWITASLSSVPIEKVPSSSSLTFTSLCKNFPNNESLVTKISFKPSLDSFLAFKKLILSPNLITTSPVFASVTSYEKFFAL